MENNMNRNNENLPLAVKIEGFEKHYKDFDLGPLNFEIPSGFTTALIGENGAGKTTLLDAIGGIASSDNKITWLEKYTDLDQNNGEPRNEVAWCANNRYFPEYWSMKNVKRVMPLAFNNFNMEKFDSICKDFNLPDDSKEKNAKKISSYSSGNKTRLFLASLLARETKLLVLDEPDAALDPLIRDKLNSKFREYIRNGNGSTSILFSTHNVADMENIVDYAVFLSKGKILKEGFVEDLRENYRYVHGDKALSSKVSDFAESVYIGDYEFEALCKTNDCENLGDEIAVEVPTLCQLSIMILRSGE